jgi:cell division protein FtsL
MLTKILWFVAAVLLFFNVYVFVSNLRLGDEIKTFDKKIVFLRQENLDLETKIFKLNSYENIASVAAQLNFVKKEMPVYLEDLKYAYKN